MIHIPKSEYARRRKALMAQMEPNSIAILPAAAVADDRRVQMEGEAKFLRALYYYMLVTYYNGVPLILEEPVYAHGSLPRASREEVVRAILDDLNDIIDRELLDWQWTKAADQGRATRGAAMAC